MAIKVSVLDVASHVRYVMELLPDSPTDDLLPVCGEGMVMRCHGRLVQCGMRLSEAGIADGDVVELISGLV